MIVTLGESEANLDQLVERAAAGEEVLITVQGEPKARLVAAPKADMQGWVNELTTLHREQLKAKEIYAIIDDICADRW